MGETRAHHKVPPPGFLNQALGEPNQRSGRRLRLERLGAVAVLHRPCAAWGSESAPWEGVTWWVGWGGVGWVWVGVPKTKTKGSWIISVLFTSWFLEGWETRGNLISLME